MCNRARASIKALQVLGNSIRGLSMANWRLVLNAVCLPVMTWGCQLWFHQGGTKGLVKNLQLVQNEMVKVVMGSFHTAPRETCHGRVYLFLSSELKSLSLDMIRWLVT
jgi:hypothetical protein